MHLTDSVSTVGKISVAIVVHGRFHAFDLARALQKRSDVNVILLTNYSARECQKFGIRLDSVKSFVLHRFAQAFCYRVIPWFMPQLVQRVLHTSFGHWAAKTLSKQKSLPNVIRIFSGVAEEVLDAPALKECKKVLTRGSSHILSQQQILEQERERAGVAMDMPSAWMVARETREYEKTDAVVVLSKFAANTFLQQGFDQQKLWLIPNAVNLDWYRANEFATEARKERILSGAKLRILMVGSFLFRKGIIDFAAVAAHFKDRMEFRFVGDLPTEGQDIKRSLESYVEFRTRVPPQDLPEQYAWGDIFFFPTVEDGFPAVLSQAMAAGLSVITTPNGSGPDLIQNGRNGWIVNVRDQRSMIEKLQYFDADRSALVASCKHASESIAMRSWDDVADDFIKATHRFSR
jgi:glycosyltransferase involved in cell wall biosynthesis